MKTNFTLSAFLLFAMCTLNGYSQSANQSLSNLKATSINRSLVPDSNSVRNLGSKKLQWGSLYFNGYLFSDTIRIMNVVGDNVGLGKEALKYNSFSAMTGYSNTAIGTSALSNNRYGYLNTVVGDVAMLSNTSGWWNTAVGAQCLYSNTTGIQNTAVGIGALFANTRGQNNTAVGSDAMPFMQTGKFNTAMGSNALGVCALGSNNTAIGEYTLHQADASGNTALGTNAGSYTGNLDNNTYIGFNAYASADLVTNSTALGYDAHTTASDQVRVGNSAITSIGGVVGWSNLSDGRYKKNVQTNVPGLSFIQALRPITYTLDAKGLDAYYKKEVPQKKDDKGNLIEQPSTAGDAELVKQENVVYSGFVAQEVEAAAKKLNYTFSGVDAPKSEKDLYGLRYSEFVVPLVKAVQELGAKNDSLTTALSSLQQQVNELKAMMTGTQYTDKNAQTLPVSVANPSLEQNIPNPARQATRIAYHLPSGYTGAQLVVANAEGKTIKQVTLTAGNGSTSLDVASLSAGTYTYTLIANGTVVATRQMVVTK